MSIAGITGGSERMLRAAVFQHGLCRSKHPNWRQRCHQEGTSRRRRGTYWGSSLTPSTGHQDIHKEDPHKARPSRTQVRIATSGQGGERGKLADFLRFLASTGCCPTSEDTRMYVHTSAFRMHGGEADHFRFDRSRVYTICERLSALEYA